MIRNFARNRNTERKPVEVTERADFAAKTFRAGNGWDMSVHVLALAFPITIVLQLQKATDSCEKRGPRISFVQIARS
jgi:hypothetical protein